MRKYTETEFKLDNGDRVMIRTSFAEWKNEFEIDWVAIKPKGKRKWNYAEFNNDYSYRSLGGSKEKNEYRLNKWLEIATVNMLNDSLMKAWEAIKPELIKA